MRTCQNFLDLCECDISRRFTKLYDAIMEDQEAAEVMKKCNNEKGASLKK
jgi:hypothetical protein